MSNLFNVWLHSSCHLFFSSTFVEILRFHLSLSLYLFCDLGCSSSFRWLFWVSVETMHFSTYPLQFGIRKSLVFIFSFRKILFGGSSPQISLSPFLELPEGTNNNTISVGLCSIQSDLYSGPRSSNGSFLLVVGSWEPRIGWCVHWVTMVSAYRKWSRVLLLVRKAGRWVVLGKKLL